MRYAEDEITVLAGILPPGKSVKIILEDLETGNVIPVYTDVCIESSNIEGLYKWSISNINLNTTDMISILYMMKSEDDDRTYGKLVYGGYVDKKVEVDITPLQEEHKELLDMTEVINARI